MDLLLLWRQAIIVDDNVTINYPTVYCFLHMSTWNGCFYCDHCFKSSSPTTCTYVLSGTCYHIIGSFYQYLKCVPLDIIICSWISSDHCGFTGATISKIMYLCGLLHSLFNVLYETHNQSMKILNFSWLSSIGCCNQDQRKIWYVSNCVHMQLGT